MDEETLRRFFENSPFGDMLGPNGLERVEGIASDSGLRILRRDRLPLPRPRSEARAVDLVAAASKASDASEASAASAASIAVL